MEIITENRGFFKIIVAFVILVVLFAFFGIDFRAVVGAVHSFFTSHPEVVGFLQFIWSFFVEAWTAYIHPVLLWIWSRITFFFQ